MSPITNLWPSTVIVLVARSTTSTGPERSKSYWLGAGTAKTQIKVDASPRKPAKVLVFMVSLLKRSVLQN